MNNPFKKTQEEKDIKQFWRGYDQCTREKKIELDSMKVRHSQKIEDLIKEHCDEMTNVRELVKSEFLPRIEEKQNEIKRLNTVINDNRKLYQDTKRGEIELQHKFQTLADKFISGFQSFYQLERTVMEIKSSLKGLGTTKNKDLDQLEGDQ